MQNKNFSLLDKIALTIFSLAFLFVVFTGLSPYTISFNSSETTNCTIEEGQGFHTITEKVAIKFNANNRFVYSDLLFDDPKSFWGTWEQLGNQIITINDRSTTGMGIGQKNTYIYDCDKLYLSGFTLVKD